MKVREYQVTAAGMGGRDVRLVRIVERPDGEPLPEGAERVDDAAEPHGWRVAEE